jgi:hypothetical protein
MGKFAPLAIGLAVLCVHLVTVPFTGMFEMLLSSWLLRPSIYLLVIAFLILYFPFSHCVLGS